MVIAIEIVSLCIIFFLICFFGTGTDDKNFKSYSSYPDEVQSRVKSITEYQGRFKEGNKVVILISNFLLFRFVKVPEKELYQNPKKHIEAFGRAFIMYLFIAMIDGYVLTLF